YLCISCNLCLNHRLNGRLITVWWIFRNAIAVLCRGLRRSLYSVIGKMGIGDRIKLNQINRTYAKELDVGAIHEFPLRWNKDLRAFLRKS
ncbi:MAG: hypothetical protein ACK54J_27395, partial [Pseudanabaena sp.]